jgi:hypothetical protein
MRKLLMTGLSFMIIISQNGPSSPVRPSQERFRTRPCAANPGNFEASPKLHENQEISTRNPAWATCPPQKASSRPIARTDMIHVD